MKNNYVFWLVVTFVGSFFVTFYLDWGGNASLCFLVGMFLGLGLCRPRKVSTFARIPSDLKATAEAMLFLVAIVVQIFIVDYLTRHGIGYTLGRGPAAEAQWAAISVLAFVIMFLCGRVLVLPKA